jgi:Ala-tRNA(Pro) deacylase
VRPHIDANQGRAACARILPTGQVARPNDRIPVDLTSFLARHAIVAERTEHPPVMTVEESERLVPPLPGAKTKNLFLRDKKGTRHFLVTVPHDVTVDLAALGVEIGAGRLGFASAERLQRHLGITPGSVSLLALVNDHAHAVEFVIDRRLWNAEAVHAHPLVNPATLVIRHGELERFLAATGHVPRIVDIATH